MDSTLATSLGALLKLACFKLELVATLLVAVGKLQQRNTWKSWKQAFRARKRPFLSCLEPFCAVPSHLYSVFVS